MDLSLNNVNVVVVAHHFNPSIINQLWLVENELVDRDDFKPGSVFSDMVANVRTDKFGLFVSPEQLQFAPRGNGESDPGLVADTVGGIVNILPHTPFTGVGLNYTWQVTEDDKSSNVSITRRLFYRSDNPLFSAFDTPDARFGAYMSKDALGFRLKLDIKPMSIRSKEGETEMIQFAFNFHMDILDKRHAVKLIQQALDQWNEAKNLTSEIMKQVLPQELS